MEHGSTVYCKVVQKQNSRIGICTYVCNSVNVWTSVDFVDCTYVYMHMYQVASVDCMYVLYVFAPFSVSSCVSQGYTGDSPAWCYLL